MTEVTTIYLVRHGESTQNRQGLLSGHGDPPLTPRGKAQAEAIRAKLQQVHFDAVYASDLQRAIETAEIISGRPVPAANRAAGLRERNFGTLEGKPRAPWDEIGRQKEAMPHERAWTHKGAPGLESDHELSSRFLPALEKVAQGNPGKTLLVVAHGGAIRAALIKLGGFTYAQMPAGSFKNGGYVELTYTPGNGLKVVHIEGVQI